jgi:hypothetical protein
MMLNQMVVFICGGAGGEGVELRRFVGWQMSSMVGCLFTHFSCGLALSLKQRRLYRNRKKRCAWLMVFAMRISICKL